MSVTVRTADGRAVSDAFVEVILPTGERVQVELDEAGSGSYRTVTAGTHRLTVSRNGIILLDDRFESAGFVEVLYTSVGVGLEAIVGTTILQTPVQLLIFVAMCLIAAFVAYSKSRLLFVRKAKSTRQKQIEGALRIAASLVFFVLPLQVNKFLGFGAGVAFVLLEIIITFLFDYYTKRALRRRKAIKVEVPEGFKLKL